MQKKLPPMALFMAGLILLALACLNTSRNSGTEDQWLPGKEYLDYFTPLPFERAHSNFKYISAMDGKGGEHNEVLIAQNPQKAENGINETNFREDTFFAALTLLKSGKLAEAEAGLLRHLAINPSHSEAWRQLGDCRYNLGKVDGALKAYQKALTKKPTNYLAKRGKGVASLYMGYDYFEKRQSKAAHKFFQDSLNCLHECIEVKPDDPLASYGQALAAEGVSRELYRIAVRALNGESHEAAKNVIRNCLDIVDVAIIATHERLDRRPEDNDARMLLGGLYMRRAKILQPFGHLDEASDNLAQAELAYQPVVAAGGDRAKNARAQLHICQNLAKSWQHK